MDGFMLILDYGWLSLLEVFIINAMDIKNQKGRKIKMRKKMIRIIKNVRIRS